MNRRIRSSGWLLVAAALVLAGCEADNDSTELAGTWQASKLVFTDAAGSRIESILPASWSETLVLNLDGTFAFTSTRSGRTQTGSGEWRETADGLVLVGRKEAARAYRFSEKSLVLSGVIPEGSYSLIWRRTAGAM